MSEIYIHGWGGVVGVEGVRVSDTPWVHTCPNVHRGTAPGVGLDPLVLLYSLVASVENNELGLKKKINICRAE